MALIGPVLDKFRKFEGACQKSGEDQFLGGPSSLADKLLQAAHGIRVCPTKRGDNWLNGLVF